MDGYHRTIFISEILEFLDVKEGEWYLDATLGDGGHSLEILKLGGNVVGVDVDPDALDRAKRRFQEAEIPESRYKLIQGNFREIDSLAGSQKFSGAVADLGVSTLQLKVAEKGFSLMQNGPLDMRMDPNLSVSAVDLVNVLHKGELVELFLKYGEEGNAKKIAEEIILARPLTTTTDLTQAVERAVGKKKGYTHPATQIFQALRIAVNDEMFALKEGLPKLLSTLIQGSRLCIISFHSLEDGIVKNVFRELEELGQAKILTDKPINPTEQEIFENIRSRSAKLRVVEKNA
jgi:16S rRNA (cytosine1402-N4)-methyltransferase